MRAISFGFTTAATTIAGGSGGQGSLANEAVAVMPGPSNFVQGVFLSWASSAASTVPISFRHGQSSDAFTSIALAIPDSSASNNVYVPLGVPAADWEVSVPTTMAKGLSAIVYIS